MSASSFVGRTRELAAIAERFDAGARLVTVLGPGGIGKTRLAARFLADQATAFSGAWTIDLEAARSATDARAAIASALGVSGDDVGGVLERRGRVLLVLDNAESLGAEARVLVDDLLRAAPHAVLLLTSRVATEADGEHLWPLEPLAEDDATALFLDRARQVRPTYAPSAEERVAIADVVRRVDGIPLAVELAAARLGVLSAKQIAERLSPSLLSRRDGSERHASMRAAIDDSLRLLGEREREALARASVFRGPFTLEAAEAVLDVPDAIATLDALRARSLLRVTTPASGDVRFALYAPIREVASELLGSDDGPRARHASFFARRGGALDLVRLGEEHDDLVAAWETAVAARDAGSALDLALALDRLLRARGRGAMRVRLLDGALALDGDGDRVARALTARGEARRALGDLDGARADYDRALEAARGANDASVRAHIGELVEAQGATVEAKRWFAEAIASSRGVVVAHARTLLAHTLRREGRLDDAEEELARAEDLLRDARDEEGLVRTLFESAVVLLFRERHEEAARALDEVIGLAERLGLRQRAADALTAKGTLLQERGAIDDAIACHAAALAIFRDGGDPYAEGSTLYYLAGAYLERGHRDDAKTLARQALDRVSRVASHRYEALVRGLLAAIAAAEGARDRAAFELDHARRAAEACTTEPSLDATLAIHALHLEPTRDLARARALAAARACDDPRFALRVLERTVAEETPALVVAADGSSFRVPGADVDVDLARRVPLRRVLQALATRRRDAPGEPLALHELAGAGWPGERIAHSAAANRVHVALAELRKLGLRELLESSERGWALSARVRLVLLDA